MQKGFQIAVESITHLVISRSDRMNSVILTDYFGRVILIDGLFQYGEIVFGIDIHVHRNNSQVEFFTLRQ